MGELAGLEALGNVAAIPVIIFLTQLIKKRIGDFKYGSDLLALVLSFFLCIGWTFYDMTPAAYVTWSSYSGLAFFKWSIDQVLIGFATWLAATKIYDLGHGNKKRNKKVAEEVEAHATEKVKLEEEIVKLKNGHGDTDEQTEKGSVVSDKLREILEG